MGTMWMEEIEQWQADVRSLLAIPEAERTEQEQIRLWARRVRLLGNGWRVVLSNGEPVFLRVVPNEEYWHEILKERFEDVASSSNQTTVR